MESALCRSKGCDVDAIMSDGIAEGLCGASCRGGSVAGNGRGQTGIPD